jgi:hypothetical protein
MIATRKAFSLYCFLPLSSRVASTRQTSWHLYECRLPKSHKGDPYL